jgi:N-acetyl-alpha-D-muramate 1-phosphate uridylyltransferase
VSLPPICILAGGRGARLGERTADTPKPLLEVAGQPFLFHQLRLLAAHGARRVVLCVGYRGDLIEQRIGSVRFGIDIDYSYDSPRLDGTLGAIRRALSLLGDRFLVLYGDTYLRLDYGAAVRSWIESGQPAMMTVLRNDGQWDKSNVLYGSERVLAYDKQNPTPDMRWIDYGLGGLEPRVLDVVGGADRDLALLYQRLAELGWLHGFEATERFHEIGTPQALQQTDAFLMATGSPAGP